MSANSSETTSDETSASEEQLHEQTLEAKEFFTQVSLFDYDLGRSFFSIPFHPFLHHALQRKGVEIATRTQLALFDHSKRYSHVFFPLNRGGGRFVAMCLLLLNRALRGERFLIVVNNKVLRKYIAADMESLGAFCPLDVSVFHQVHERIGQVLASHHIIVTPLEGLLEAIDSVETQISEIIVIEPEFCDPAIIYSLQEKVNSKRLLGLYQKEKALKPDWFQTFTEACFVQYQTQIKQNKTYHIQQNNRIEQIQRIALHVDAPMLVVCADEEDARSVYGELAQEFSLVVHLPQTSLRRNKEQAYRLLASKKIQLIVISASEYSKKYSFPVIYLGEEPIKTELDCYWIAQSFPEEERNEGNFASLEVLRQRSQQHIIHELQKSTFNPVAKDIDDLYETIKDSPLLLKAALKDSVQYQTHRLFDQLQEALRIEEKEAFARKKNWKTHPKKRKKRR